MALARLLPAAPNQAIRNMLPQGPGEMVLFVMLALTAGFCEELIYRGYLQRQLGQGMKSALGGIALGPACWRILQDAASGLSAGHLLR